LLIYFPLFWTATRPFGKNNGDPAAACGEFVLLFSFCACEGLACWPLP
jgi:hypothetical protein